MRKRYLHRCRERSFVIRANAMSAVGIEVVSVHKLFAYRVVSAVRREQSYDNNIFLFTLIVYAHVRRLCSNWVRHGSTTISYPQCSLTFMRERYLHLDIPRALLA